MDIKALLDELDSFDAPTVCNGLELIDNSYRLNGYGLPGMMLRAGKDKPVSGVATTATISAVKPPTAEQAELRNKLYAAAGETELPSIICMKDIDKVHIGSFWGEMQASIFRSLGAVGTINEGGVRDLDCCDSLGFTFFSTEILVSHANVHVESIQEPVEILGQTITPGDIVHADKHGFVVFPIDLLEQVIAACKHLEKAESYHIQPCRDAIKQGRKPSIDEIIAWNKKTNESKASFGK